MRKGSSPYAGSSFAEVPAGSICSGSVAAATEDDDDAVVWGACVEEVSVDGVGCACSCDEDGA